MIFGMNIAQQLDDRASKPTMTFDEQIEMLTKLKSLLDAGILSQDEFDQRKKKSWIYNKKMSRVTPTHFLILTVLSSPFSLWVRADRK